MLSIKKELFAIMAVVATLAFGAIPAVASSATVAATSTPMFCIGYSGNLATIRITDLWLNAGETDHITISAPDGVEFANIDATNFGTYVNTPQSLPGAGPGVVNVASAVYTKPDTTDLFTFDVTNSGTVDGEGTVDVTLPVADLTDPGCVNVYLQDSNGLVPWGKITVGVIIGEQPPPSVLSTANITQGESGSTTISIGEGYANAFEGGGYVTIELPSGFQWTGTPTISAAGGWSTGSVVATIGGIGDRQINLYFPTEVKNTSGQITGYNPPPNGTAGYSGVVGELQLTATIMAAGTAPVGDIQVSIGGTINNGIWSTFPVGTCEATKVVNSTATTPGSGTKTGGGSAQFTVGVAVYSVNNVKYGMDVAPYISNGHTFVPVRYLANALGAKINWDAATRTVTLTQGLNTQVLIIGSNTMTLNGTAQTMDVAAVIVNGRTMLPARWVAECFGAQVAWNPAAQVVDIHW